MKEREGERCNTSNEGRVRGGEKERDNERQRKTTKDNEREKERCNASNQKEE